MMSKLLRSTILRLAIVSLTGAYLFPRPLAKAATPTGANSSASFRIASFLSASRLTSGTLVSSASLVTSTAEEEPDERRSDSREASSDAASSAPSTTDAAPPTPQMKAEAETEKRNAARSEKSPPAYRLPRYYGKLELTDAQRSEVLAVLKNRNPQIKALQQQLRELREAKTAELEEVLTKSQRTRLSRLTVRRPS